MHITAAEACQEEPLPSTQVQQYKPRTTWDHYTYNVYRIMRVIMKLFPRGTTVQLCTR